MKVQLLLFVSSGDEATTLVKTFESDIRPMQGDLIDDPGFDSRFHNGYEVVKVTINYERDECLVSLTPIAIEIEEISFTEYIDKLTRHGWEKHSTPYSLQC